VFLVGWEAIECLVDGFGLVMEFVMEYEKV